MHVRFTSSASALHFVTAKPLRRRARGVRGNSLAQNPHTSANRAWPSSWWPVGTPLYRESGRPTGWYYVSKRRRGRADGIRKALASSNFAYFNSTVIRVERWCTEAIYHAEFAAIFLRQSCDR
jgi:hypothetical protein